MADKFQKVTLNLFPGDAARLQELYPVSGYGKAIRILVRRHLEAVDAKIAAEIGAPHADTDL